MVGLNLNSILSFIVLGVMGWVGMKTASNSDSLTEIKATQPYLNQAVNDVKSQLQSLVTRAEFDSRMSESKATNLSLENRIHTLEIETKTKELRAK